MTLLPYAQIQNYLAPAEICALLDCVLSNEARFTPATVGPNGASVVDLEQRISLTWRDLGPLQDRLRDRFLESLPMLMSMTGAVGTPPSLVEMELAAHGDGAFYLRHIDLPIGDVSERRPPKSRRILSAVLYFHTEPKAFSGGELRLFRLGASGARGDDFVELQPLQNSLVVFHSWVPHEVRPVSCPTREFRNYRFAVNCWFRRESAP